MSLIDIFLLIPAVWLAYRGFSKGFVIEIASLLALVAGIFVAVHFSSFASDFLTANINISEKYLPIIAFVVTFLVVVLGVHLVGKLLEKIVDLIALGFINKLAGGIFGVAKAAIFLSVIIFFIVRFDTHEKFITAKQKQQSLFYSPVASILPAILEWVDQEDFAGKAPKTILGKKI